MLKTEIDAFEDQINLNLLGSIVSFVTHTANATPVQKAEMRRRCIFSDFPADPKVMQQEYGFLYLGELLERYEERFGMTLQDRRAIALALGYTKDIATDGMFVGSQRTDFIQSVRRSAQGDVYLTGALYLLYEGQSDGLAYENLLKERQYDRTEELIFAMSLFQDVEQVLAHFKPQLPRLLGSGRTMPIFGNTQILQWVMAMLFPLKKLLKAKDMAVIRALLALPVSYVKEGDRPYRYLRECGYTPLEIAYANVMAVESRCVPGGLRRNSIIAEKIATSLFRTVMAHEEALPSGIYGQLTELYSMYSRFEIKCYGVYNLQDALKDVGHIKVPETMAWFIGRESVAHPAVGSFDIMDEKWDSLAASLEPELYQRLFEYSLYESMGTNELRHRIDRYNELTQSDYLDYYSTHYPGRCFSLLVNAGIIDLWTAFQSSLAPDGSVVKPAMLSQIQDYVSGIKTAPAFRFFAQFLPQYGFHGLKQHFDPYRRGFSRELWVQKGYGTEEIVLTLQRSFLKDDPEGHLLMLHWVDEYFFTEEPERYLLFARAVLMDNEIASLLSPEDRRRLFELVINDNELSKYTAERLKQLYQTPEEQLAELAAKEAEKAEKKRREHMELVQGIETYYADASDGTFAFVVKFLKKYRYYEDREEISVRVAYERLEPLLQSKGYILDRTEADCFLRVCRKLFCHGAMDWVEIQSYILKIKEAVSDASDCNPAA